MNRFIIPGDPEGTKMIRKRLDWFLDKLDPTKTWQVEVKLWRPTRTRKQENTLWGVVYPQIVTHLGGAVDKDMVHEGMRDTYPIRTKENPLTKRHYPVSSTDLNREEYSQYLELVLSHWAKEGLCIMIENEV